MKRLVRLVPAFLCFFCLMALVDSCSKNDVTNPPPKSPLSPSIPPVNGPDNSTYTAVNAFPLLTFTNPVDLQHAGDGSNRIFVVEQPGRISVFSNDSTTKLKNIFLDINSEVESTGAEQGLLGLAFHPQYKSNGFFFVNYTASNPERSVISRFTVSATDMNKADPASEVVLLTYAQPFINHNAGQLAFGPDGFLYVAVGDGGSGGDPNGNGQNRAALLGKILRIDVNTTNGKTPYGIPPDNPFAKNTAGYKEEVYAWGMRNPWRLSFDPDNGTLWCGDVGQDHYEELDIITKGGNYGWNTMEAKHCFKDANCDETGLTLPVFEYGRTDGNAVIGGHIYRGISCPNLKGFYIYTDNGSHHVWKLNFTDLSNPVRTLLFDTDFAPASFGVDQQNELYICGLDGKIYRLKRA